MQLHGDVHEANGAKGAQRIVSQRSDGVDGSAKRAGAQVVKAAAGEVFHSLVLYVVEPGGVELTATMMRKVLLLKHAW